MKCAAEEEEFKIVHIFKNGTGDWRVTSSSSSDVEQSSKNGNVYFSSFTKELDGWN